MNYLLLVNKNNRLKPDFIPNDLSVVENRKGDNPNMILLLEKKAHRCFNEMVETAYKEVGFDIICDSAYRSYDYQKELYEKLIVQNKDLSYLACPGESEHQTGLAVDVAAYQNGVYVDNPEHLQKEYDWLYKNCSRFGFILRYPLGKEWVTGYPYEPWHFRYVGEIHARIITQRGITLEEYLEE